MGLFRKMTSLSTLGAVDFRSDKERIARYTRQTRNAVRGKPQGRSIADVIQDRRQPAPVALPLPGWYPDPVDARYVRWFDGYQFVGAPRRR
jgi:hypothetical protein